MGEDLKKLADEILRLDEEATRGPWVDCSWDPMERPHVYARHFLEAHNRDAQDVPYTQQDAALIAAYRTLAPLLARTALDRLAAVEREKASLSAEHEALIDHHADVTAAWNDALHERDGAREALALAVEALEQAHHSLATLHGLTAIDNPGRVWAGALEDGLDANAAWDCLVEAAFRVSTLRETEMIDATLARLKGVCASP